MKKPSTLLSALPATVLLAGLALAGVASPALADAGGDEDADAGLGTTVSADADADNGTGTGTGTDTTVTASPAKGLPPGLPDSVFSYQDHWIDFPKHVVCDDDGGNFAELLIALSDTWTGGSSFEVINGTGDQDYSAEDYPGMWPQAPQEILQGAGFADVAAGEWTSYSVPIDDRGAQVWLRDLVPDEDHGGPVGGGFSHTLYTDGGDVARCQAPPVAPEQDGNRTTLPEVEGITYHVAPREIDGRAVSGFSDGGYFVGYLHPVTGEVISEQVPSGTFDVPASGLQVTATAGGYLFDFGYLHPVDSSWEFDPEPVSPTELPFTDVDPKSVHYPAIEWVYASGITTGTSKTKYSPKQSVNRAQMALFLYRLAGEPDVALPRTSPFPDVKPSDASYTAIVWLVDRGITQGVKREGRLIYDKSGAVTRGQMSAFLYRYAGSPDYTPPTRSEIDDVPASSVFYTEINWLAENGITTPYTSSAGDTLYRPKAEVLREQMASFLYRISAVL